MKKTSVKKLYRSQSQKVLTGVCGGLAEYFNLDVTVIRLAFIILTVIGGSGLLIYIIMSIVVPINPTSHPHSKIHSKLKRKKLLGLIAIGLGLIILTNNLMPEFWQLTSTQIFLPLLIITLGFMMIIKQSE
jgi:phage shock protein C